MDAQGACGLVRRDRRVRRGGCSSGREPFPCGSHTLHRSAHRTRGAYRVPGSASPIVHAQGDWRTRGDRQSAVDAAGNHGTNRQVVVVVRALPIVLSLIRHP